MDGSITGNRIEVVLEILDETNDPRFSARVERNGVALAKRTSSRAYVYGPVLVGRTEEWSISIFGSTSSHAFELELNQPNQETDEDVEVEVVVHSGAGPEPTASSQGVCVGDLLIAAEARKDRTTHLVLRVTQRSATLAATWFVDSSALEIEYAARSSSAAGPEVVIVVKDGGATPERRP